MKKALIGLFSFLLLVSLLIGCGSNSKEDSQKSIKKYQLGETVSTDIIELTITDAEFTYVISKDHEDYNAPREIEGSYNLVARKGKTFVSLTLSAKNTDRGGHLVIGGSKFEHKLKDLDWPFFWHISYNGVDYPIKGYNSNDEKGYKAISLYELAESDDGEVFKPNVGAHDRWLGAGYTVIYRIFGFVEMEPEALDDPFDLIVNLVDSAGEESTFVYQIGER